VNQNNPLPARPPFDRAEFERNPGPILNRGRWANAIVHLFTLDGSRWVVKDFRPRTRLVRETIGALLVWRELRGLRRVTGIPGVPQDAFRLDRHALVYRYSDGIPLAQFGTGMLPTAFWAQFEQLLRAVHSRGLVHLDVRNARNTLVDTQGKPMLLDFQSHLGTGWLPARLRKSLEDFDLSGVYKHWAGSQPESLGEQRTALLNRMNRWRRFWILRGYLGLPRVK
jgi:hypothetical protein